MGTSLKLSSQQEELKAHAYLQMRLFYSRPWQTPHFPWMMINSKPGLGVRTAIGSINPHYQAIDALQWNVLGGKGNPTLQQIGQWSSQQKSTLIIRNIHMLGVLSQENPWYRAVIGEIFNLLQGSLSDCLEAEQAAATVRNLFVIGVGDWTVDEHGHIVTDHKYHTSHGVVSEKDPAEFQGLHHLLGAFHSKPWLMHAPTEEEWNSVIQACMPNIPAAQVRQHARELAGKHEGFHKLGEVISDHLMDTHVPEIKFESPASATLTSQPAAQPAESNLKFARSRVRLLLCKIYGEVGSQKLRQAIAHTLETLTEENERQKSVDELLQLAEKLNQGEYKALSVETRNYLLKQISTASLILTKGSIS
jgi:hypothetical protein